MPAWVTLTPNDVLAGLTATERTDFATASVDPEVPDRLEALLADLTAEIRGYIVTWAANPLSADSGKIPPSFRARAVAIARWRLLVSVPDYDPGDARKLEYEAAEAFFRKVAEGKIRPEPADDAVTNPVPPEAQFPTPVIKSRRRLWTRESQDGI